MRASTLRDGDLPSLAADLDLLATSLRDSVNAVQADPAGRDLDGLAGSPLFAGTGAADLTVALSDPRGIAAAQSTVSGDNSNALALVGLRTTTLPALSGVTLGDYFGNLQAQVGSAVRDAADAVTVEDGLLANVSRAARRGLGRQPRGGVHRSGALPARASRPRPS